MVLVKQLQLKRIIYKTKKVINSGFEINIPDAITSKKSIKVYDVEYVADAYEEILKGVVKLWKLESIQKK